MHVVDGTARARTRAGVADYGCFPTVPPHEEARALEPPLFFSQSGGGPLRLPFGATLERC